MVLPCCAVFSYNCLSIGIAGDLGMHSGESLLPRTKKVLGSIAGLCMFFPSTLTPFHHGRTCEKGIRFICYSKVSTGVNGCLTSHHLRFRLKSVFGPKSNTFDFHECTTGSNGISSITNEGRGIDGCHRIGYTCLKSLLQIGLWSF